MKVNILLLDADGVLQYPILRWRKALKPIFASESEGQFEQILHDILQAEQQSLVCSSGFIEKLKAVLMKWNYLGLEADILRVMNAINTDPSIMQIVQSVRHSDIRCYIASNQQDNRANYMSNTLNYRNANACWLK